MFMKIAVYCCPIFLRTIIVNQILTKQLWKIFFKTQRTFDTLSSPSLHNMFHGQYFHLIFFPLTWEWRPAEMTLLTDAKHMAAAGLLKHSLPKEHNISERFLPSGREDGFFEALKHGQKANFLLSALEIIADNIIVICIGKKKKCNFQFLSWTKSTTR